MAEHSDAAEQIDEPTPPEEGTDVDQHDTDADLAENAEMPAPQRFSDTRALITVGFVIFAALAGVGGWLGYRVYQDRQAQAQRNLYVEVARQTAVNLTTIDYTRADADIKRILDSATGDAYLKWLDGSARASRTAAEQAVKVATESTIAILLYRPDNVERDLKGAADRLTGGFRQQYTQLVSDVVAPGAKQQHISAVATVPAAASVSATENHAVVLFSSIRPPPSAAMRPPRPPPVCASRWKGFMADG